MLAYSSISQVGYIVLGLGCGYAAGHRRARCSTCSTTRSSSRLLFVNAAALEQRLGTTDMNRMGGLGRACRSPASTSVIATLSTAGIPPLAGFWSKLIIIIALWQTGHITYAVVAVLISVVTLAYLLVMQRRIFFGKVAEGFQGVREAGPGLVVPAVVLAVLTIAPGVLFPVGARRALMLPVGGQYALLAVSCQQHCRWPAR